MQTLEDVARLAAGLPQVTEGVDKFRKTSRTWEVGGKAFAWERPFSKADIKRFGDQQPPDGPILAIRTADLAEKDVILAANPAAFFTIPHFDGYAAVLVRLQKIPAKELKRVIVEAWIARAPERSVRDYLTQTRAT